MNYLEKVVKNVRTLALSFRAFWFNNGPYTENKQFSKAAFSAWAILVAILGLTFIFLYTGMYKDPYMWLGSVAFAVLGLIVLFRMPLDEYAGAFPGNDYIGKIMHGVFNRGILQHHLSKMITYSVERNERKAHLHFWKFARLVRIYLAFVGDSAVVRIEDAIRGQLLAAGERRGEFKPFISLTESSVIVDWTQILVITETSETGRKMDDTSDRLSKRKALAEFLIWFVHPVWKDYIDAVGVHDRLKTKAGIVLMYLQVSWAMLVLLDDQKEGWGSLCRELDASGIKLGVRSVRLDIDSVVLPSQLTLGHSYKTDQGDVHYFKNTRFIFSKDYIVPMKEPKN